MELESLFIYDLTNQLVSHFKFCSVQLDRDVAFFAFVSTGYSIYRNVEDKGETMVGEMVGEMVGR